MNESRSEKYLGDIVHNSGSLKPNVAMRLFKGWGKISEILAIIKEAPLGRKRIQAGLLLRKSLLLNGTLFNSEAWHGFTRSQITAFEKIDEALIKGLTASHSKIPSPAVSRLRHKLYQGSVSWLRPEPVYWTRSCKYVHISFIYY